jgi:hypothetical protein
MSRMSMLPILAKVWSEIGIQGLSILLRVPRNRYLFTLMMDKTTFKTAAVVMLLPTWSEEGDFIATVRTPRILLPNRRVDAAAT